MAMTIMNDASAAMTLGELNKNISSLGKQLKKVSSGMRINSAGDDASGYSISEKMRVRIRALDQDERNVQNGAALLRVAEGAIQSQIEIMKTIKEKAIDADNDTNTDLDRATIQKEIDQGYRQIQDIAWETNYNGKRLLVGDNKIDEIWVWQVMPEPVTTPDSSLDIIPDIYPVLDGEEGPFAALSAWQETSAKATPLLGENSSVNFTGGGTVYSTFTMSFENYTNPSQLDGVGFKSGSYYYVLTANPTGKNYIATASNEKYVAREIDISGLTVEQIATKVAKYGLNGTRGEGTVSGKTITFTSNYTSDSDSYVISGWSATETSAVGGSAGATGLFPSGAYAEGTDKVSHFVHNPVTDLDDEVVDAAASVARLTQNISSAANGSGITVKDHAGNQTYIKFVDGNEELKRQNDGSYTVGRSATVYSTALYTRTSPTVTDLGTRVGVNFSLSGGNMTLTTSSAGKAYTINVTDGFNRSGNWDYQGVAAFSGTVTKPSGGSSGQAYYSIDLTDYDTTDAAKVDEFVDALVGKAVSMRRSSYSSPYVKYEFIDTTKPKSMDAIFQTNISSGYTVDLKKLRDKVQAGATIADAFISIMTASNIPGNSTNAANSRFSVEAGTKVLKVKASNSGLAGNNETIEITEGKLGQYTIDFADYFQNHSISIPADLDGKGFRIYCATCPDQWFNFQFSAGETIDATRPPSGSSGADLKTTIIDISEVTDVDSLVKTFYEKANEAMNNPSHTLGLAADFEEGKVTFYDTRRFKLIQGSGSNRFPYVAEKGAKIADGVLDDVQKVKRGIYVKDLVIQDTDHASQNIRVRIPQTTLDHLFNYIEGPGGSISDYNVLSTESREMLLGNMKGRKRDGSVIDKEEKGALDLALDYLTSANTLIGAQIMRLGMTEANIVTSRESTQNSESTLRDADMAKEMVGYTKANVLAQAAQSMLAQANQNSSAILGLLQ